MKEQKKTPQKQLNKMGPSNLADRVQNTDYEYA